MKPLDRIGTNEQDVVAQRRRDGYRSEASDDGLAEVRETLGALLDQLLPGVPPTVDLVAFIEANTGRPLGRGDRRAGTPAEPELFRAGLGALERAGFLSLDDASQRELITRMRRGQADQELETHAKEFIDRLLAKALTGYMAHPDVWERIGFGGPAYPEGYAWIGLDEVSARHQRKRGWESL
ncbi:MAG TPA: gluconate 2-dehydrogenase subunit 3 family protein [Acidimicrobiales bacterium]|nr:gluconate 2-dehydrogenase subunit 3 family protein [Acidimicrobiales bacterium]